MARVGWPVAGERVTDRLTGGRVPQPHRLIRAGGSEQGTSGQALAGVVGPLIEVLVVVGFVYAGLWLRRRWVTRAGQQQISEEVGR